MRSAIRANRVGLVFAVTTAVVGTFVALVGIAVADSPSDPTRANFSGGNAVNCAQVGFPGDTLAFAHGNDSINDGNVAGQVLPNTAANGGTIGVPNGELANVQNIGGVTIDAIVLKGGTGFNVYGPATGTAPGSKVPPTLASPQHYIPPFNNGGNIPGMSHWFICYSGGTPPETGSLAV